MRKLISLLLALAVVFSLGLTAFADSTGENPDTTPKESQNAKFYKEYTVVNAQTQSPEETFEFEFKKHDVKPGEASVNFDNMPQIGNVTTHFWGNYAEAENDKVTNEVEVKLGEIQWPGIGEYIYTVEEIPGKTAGVDYDTRQRFMKVSVQHDVNNNYNNYYVAYVTMEFKDETGGEDGGPDGINDDNKTDTIKNKYEAGKLAVKKTVTGNMGDRTRDFFVRVVFQVPAGFKVKDDIWYFVDGQRINITPADWDQDGYAAANLELKHDETVTFFNIPYEVHYSVQENDYSNEKYVTTYKKDEDAVSTSYVADFIGKPESRVEIINDKTSTVDTGIVLDSLPYVLLLAVAVIGLAVVLGRKRMARD